MERLKQLLAEYGRVALGTYLAIFVLALGGFALALSQGLELASLDLGGAGNAGVFAGAYVATKLIQPARIAATTGQSGTHSTAVRVVTALRVGTAGVGTAGVGTALTRRAATCWCPRSSRRRTPVCAPAPRGEA